jgi:tRNA G18 (ribose-2'-O)-methylase SpoU
MAIASVQTVTSFDRPELTPYRTLRQEHQHWLERIFVAEGEKVVRRLLASDHEVVSVLLPEKWYDALRPLIEQRPESIQVYTADKKLLEGLTGFSMYQGLLAVGRRPPPLPLEVAWQRSGPPRLWAAVDGLANAENLGALVRNCVAFGVQALLVGETSCSPYLRRAVRSSMGTIMQLPLVETHQLIAALAQARVLGLRCLAAHPHAERRAITQVDFTGDCCLVFGSEGEGLSPAIRLACDAAVSIPMPPTVDSLNVASAAAVFLYEVSRQRQNV